MCVGTLVPFQRSVCQGVLYLRVYRLGETKTVLSPVCGNTAIPGNQGCGRAHNVCWCTSALPQYRTAASSPAGLSRRGLHQGQATASAQAKGGGSCNLNITFFFAGNVPGMQLHKKQLITPPCRAQPSAAETGEFQYIQRRYHSPKQSLANAPAQSLPKITKQRI
jgi:hypothetical protein